MEWVLGALVTVLIGLVGGMVLDWTAMVGDWRSGGSSE
jgi:hypothetical protein